MLDLKLHTFLTVVETGSYTAAAERLHLTQPAVTGHIRKLEEHYGVPFFRQDGRTMRLTAQGEQLLHYARLQRAREEQLVQRLGQGPAPLRLGATLSIADYYLPPLLAGLARRGELPRQLSVANTQQLLGRLAEGSMDAAFIEGNFPRELYQAEVLCQARFLPVAAADHPLAGRGVTLEQLHAYPLVLREPGSGTRGILESFLTLQGDGPASFQQVWEVNSFLLIKGLLEHTQALSFLYEGVAAREIREGRLAPLDLRDFRLVHPLHFVFLKDHLERDRLLDLFRACAAHAPGQP